MKKTKKQKTKRLGNEKGIALLWAYTVAVFSFTVLTGLHQLSITDLKNNAVETQRVQALYLAEAGIDKVLTGVRNDSYTPISNQALGTFGTYSATYASSSNLITATGKVGNVTVKVTAQVDLGKTMPPGVKGAVTAQYNLNIASDLTIDGRDHLASGALNGQNAGYYGIAYLNQVSSDNTVKVGGFSESPTVSPFNPAVVNDLDTNDDNISVNAVLGLAEESTVLDQYKSLNAPTDLSNSVYYYETTGTSETIVMGTQQNPWSGILIISDPNNNASDIELQGYMKGLVIVDNAKLNGVTIVGAIVGMSPSESAIRTGANQQPNPEDGFGGGATASQVLFSEAVLKNLPEITGASYVPKPTVKSWASSENGSNRLKKTVVS